jgi:hypothetical protein
MAGEPRGSRARAQPKPSRGKAPRGKPPAKTARKAASYCSFCLQSQHDVRMLISGPAGVFICDDCVALATQWIAGNPPAKAEKPSPDQLPTARLLEQLKPIEDTLQGKGNQLQFVVDLLRAREVSWADIGDALGISRQAAWERFT